VQNGLHDLAGAMTIHATRVGRNINNTVKATAKAVAREVITGTPVDTGKARSNWQASLGEEQDTVINPHAPGSRLGISETANANAAITIADSVIDARKPGEDVFIQNNVFYIGLLNNGSSQQAAAGFVQAAAVKATEVVQNSKVVDE
jgi:hypothetical protein